MKKYCGFPLTPTSNTSEKCIIYETVCTIQWSQQSVDKRGE